MRMHKFVLILCVAFTSLSWLIQSYADDAKQSRIDASQRQYLNQAFPKIKRNERKVRVLIKAGFRLNLLPGYRDLYLGSQFEQRDRHFDINYRVKGIDKDGIIISYKGHAWHDGQVAGEVKLKWKP
jgi:hypothetical protein